MPNKNWTAELDDSGSHFFFYLAGVGFAPIVALASTGFANPALLLVSRCGTC
jgi:hypothetical protein